MALSEEEIEKINVYQLDTNKDIYNVIRNYDINKLFDKLTIPTFNKEQLKDNLKKALTEQKTDEALRILNYVLKYKHNYYKRNDIILDDNYPSAEEKNVVLKDQGYYEIIYEAASSKPTWYSDVNSSFTHFLVKGSPWVDNQNLSAAESKRWLYLFKNFNYLYVLLKKEDNYEAYFGNYELNDKGCFFFKEYVTNIDTTTFINMSETVNSFNSKNYESLEDALDSFLYKYNFKETDNNDLLEYFEYNQSAFAAYGARQIYAEVNKTLLYSEINQRHQVFLRGAGLGKNNSNIAEFRGKITEGEVTEWLNSENKSYESKDYYIDYEQTTNLSPVGESPYLSKIIKLDSNYNLKYKLSGFNDTTDSDITLDSKYVLSKPKNVEILEKNFDRNYGTAKDKDRKYVGHIFGLDFDKQNANGEFDGFKGGGKKGYGQHLNHQDVCYWCNGDDANIKIRYLGDADAILKRVFFPNTSFNSSGKRVSLKGKQSCIDGFDYIDVPNGALIEFKYKCSENKKSLNFEKCFATVIRNSDSVFNKEYSTYGFENELDSKTIDSEKISLSFENKKKANNLFEAEPNESDYASLNDFYEIVGNDKWTFSDLFSNNLNNLKNSVDFLSFSVDKDWNYYTFRFRVFDNILLDFGSQEDEVEYYNNVILENNEAISIDSVARKEYFNKSNIHDETEFIESLTFDNKLQDRIIDDNLCSLYNKNYNDTVSIDSGNSEDQTIVLNIQDTERGLPNRRDLFHDYRIFCEQYEKIYITIKSGNSIDLPIINRNIEFGDYELEKTGYITNFYFKRTSVAPEQVYKERISVKQGEFIYFKCEYNSCRVEIDKELSSFPEDTLVYPINFDPFENKRYSIDSNDYAKDTEGYKGYEKGGNGTTFQWIRFTTSNSSYDIIVFLKKRVVEITFLNDLFGENLITKNFDSNIFEPNESFSFYVYLRENTRISTYQYSNKEIYFYNEEERINNEYAFTEDCFESFISFYDGNSAKTIKNFKNYVYDIDDILGSYTGIRNIYEVFKGTYNSFDKLKYLCNENVIFSLKASYSNSSIRISEDYIVGSKVLEDFSNKKSIFLNNSGIYRVVATSGNTGNGGNGGNASTNGYAGLISGSGGGGLYGGDSGIAASISKVSPIDKIHNFFAFNLIFYVGIDKWIGINRIIGFRLNFCIVKVSNDEKYLAATKNDPTIFYKDFAPLEAGFFNGSGTIGLILYYGVGSGQGGNGFYSEGTTDGEGSFWLGGTEDRLATLDNNTFTDNFYEDDYWKLNSAFDKSIMDNLITYYKNCFENKTKNGTIKGVNYKDNPLCERYRGVFFDTILNIFSKNKNSKIQINYDIGKSGAKGNDGLGYSVDGGILTGFPQNGLCGNEGKFTSFSFKNETFYNVINHSYFTNIDNVENKSLSSIFLCGSVHDVNPQKSFNMPENGKNSKGEIINDLVYEDMSETNSNPMKVHYCEEGTDTEPFSFDILTLDEGETQNKYNMYLNYTHKDSMFGSFSYVPCVLFYIRLVLTLNIWDIRWGLPIKFEIEGFEKLAKLKSLKKRKVVPVKYKAPLLNQCFDTISHFAYSISEYNIKLDKTSINDFQCKYYNPDQYLSFDANVHYKTEYPFEFKTQEETSFNIKGFSNLMLNSIYSFNKTYKFVKNNSVGQIYKNSIIMVSPIG
ncbi:MAG: hypothetical protein HUJ68_10695, partial [Clostridia bacterium]|nr:hypothetical protein [Clostridia bacterium]